MYSKFNPFTTTNQTYGKFYATKNKYGDDPRNITVQSYAKESEPLTYDDNNNYKNRITTPSKLYLKEESLVGKISTNFIGLYNLGNTCFINSCLQNIIHCTPFISRFLEISDKIFSQNIRPSPIANSFYELLINISNTQTSSVIPESFINKFFDMHSQFVKGQQNDTQEFCRYFLQDLNNELNIVIHPSKYKPENVKAPSKKQMFFNYRNDCLLKENSIITDLFIGYFSFEYQCECGYKENTFSQFLDLPLQMESYSGFDLYNMLKTNFYKTTLIEMGETCSFCHRSTKKSEIMRVASLPQVLIISLQRINPYTGTKNNSPVKFYEGLDLKVLIDTETFDGSSTKYELYAVTNHVGNLNDGHYYSYVKISGKWYSFDDNKCIEKGIKIEDICQKEVYTLFYVRNNSKK